MSPRPRPWTMLPALIAGLALLLAACANTPPSTSSTEPIMRLTLTMQDAISEASLDQVKYYIVFNTMTMADALDPMTASASIEATDSAGLVTSNPAGPRAYGPWRPNLPRVGADLPFYLSGPNDANSRDPRRTNEYTGLNTVLPVTWTDYFVLQKVAGTVQLNHYQHAHPLTAPEVILPNLSNLIQKQDWFIDGKTLVLLLRIKRLINGDTIANAAFPPAPATVGGAAPAAQPRILTVNFITANGNGDIIDRWNLLPEEPLITLNIQRNAQNQYQRSREVLNRGNLPGGVSPGGVTWYGYNAEMKEI